MTKTTPIIPTWTLGDRMRKALDVSGLSINEMAQYLGVGRNTVSSWLNGHTTPVIGMVRLWALRTGVSLPWLRDKPANDADVQEQIVASIATLEEIDPDLFT